MSGPLGLTCIQAARFRTGGAQDCLRYLCPHDLDCRNLLGERQVDMYLPNKLSAA
jgi:hypothetical protein